MDQVQRETNPKDVDLGKGSHEEQQGGKSVDGEKKQEAPPRGTPPAGLTAPKLSGFAGPR